MPPSMSSKDSLVIWMLRIAMKAPIVPARTAIHSRMLARAPDDGCAVVGMEVPSEGWVAYRARTSAIRACRSAVVIDGPLVFEENGSRVVSTVGRAAVPTALA